MVELRLGFHERLRHPRDSREDQPEAHHGAVDRFVSGGVGARPRLGRRAVQIRGGAGCRSRGRRRGRLDGRELAIHVRAEQAQRRGADGAAQRGAAVGQHLQLTPADRVAIFQHGARRGVLRLARLAAAAEAWRDRFAHLPRPLVAVLVGGSNGRFRLDAEVAGRLGAQLADLIRRDGAGVALTPSRRTDPEATRALTQALAPLGGWVWDGAGENPYFGLLALADAIVVTMDSVSMVSEAAATAAPVLVAPLPGKSRRIGLFLEGLTRDGRIRPFEGQLELWRAAPLDDTPLAAAEMRRRIGF
ncbi:MAG: mitochondrial fission ELM1 family protein [Proteobacteria bacterium]|nr:mitochondrial fission ELM1 family protein [Pseudomonadota bacterium]